MRRLFLMRIPQRKLVIGGLTGLTLFACYKNQERLNDIGIVRFARVGITVIFYFFIFICKASIIMCDYKWNMMGMDHESQIYKNRLKQCHSRSAK